MSKYLKTKKLYTCDSDNRIHYQDILIFIEELKKRSKFGNIETFALMDVAGMSALKTFKDWGIDIEKPLEYDPDLSYRDLTEDILDDLHQGATNAYNARIEYLAEEYNKISAILSDSIYEHLCKKDFSRKWYEIEQ